MIRGDESRPLLERQLHLLFRHFPAEIGIVAQSDGLLKSSLCRVPVRRGGVAFSEVTMVQQYRFSTRRECGLEQIKTFRHPAYNATDVTAPFHRQPIWAIIAESGNFQQTVQ